MPKIKHGHSYEAPNSFFQRDSHLDTRTYQNPYIDSIQKGDHPRPVL